MRTDVPEISNTLALRPGAMLADRFRVLRPLHGGSAFAITYRADDLTRGEAVVVKEFFPRSMVARGADSVAVRPHSTETERDFLRALRRFLIEGSVLAEIAHPHVVRARGLIEANGTAYLVMDDHRSQPLADYVHANGGRLAPAQAVRLVQHLLSALEPLHAESIVHRDLSPRSVHVQGDGSVLLLEFSARRHLPLHATDLAAGFAAFEQYGMRDIGPWTDVYAVSALLYYLLTGTTPPSALDRAAGEALPTLTSSVSNLSPGLARLVLRGMSLLPQQRPHVASELRRQLEGSLGESTVATARGPQGALSLDALGGEHSPPDDDRGSTLKLAAAGIVVPGEEPAGAGLLRRLGSAAARFRRTPVVTPAAPFPFVREEQPQPQIRAAVVERERAPAPVYEPAPVPLPVQPAAIATAPTPKPNEHPVAEEPRRAPVDVIIPAPERSIPALEEPLPPFDIAAQVAFSTEHLEATFATPANRQRRYSLLAAAALVVAIGGSLAFLARSGSASSNRILAEPTPNAGNSAKRPAASPTRSASSPAHQVVEAGAVLQSTSHPESTAVRTASDASKASDAAARRGDVTRAPRPEPVVPSVSTPKVSVAISSPVADLKIVPPAVLIDARTRLTNGQDQIEQGDYVIARRTFRLALQQLDSIAPRYPDSQAIRDLRRQIEQADARAVQACGAENEMLKRRGEQVKACQ